MEIGTEAPIRTKAEDRLRRVGYANRIAGVLSELSLREGRVFAIRGAGALESPHSSTWLSNNWKPGATAQIGLW